MQHRSYFISGFSFVDNKYIIHLILSFFIIKTLQRTKRVALHKMDQSLLLCVSFSFIIFYAIKTQ